MENEKFNNIIELLKSIYIYLDAIKQTVENGSILYNTNFENIKFTESRLFEKSVRDFFDKNINKNIKEDIEIEQDQKTSNKHEQLIEIINKVKTCLRCELGYKRTNAVPGAGPIDTKVMIIGEAPGEQEDLQGLPFVGKAGQLLTKLLENANIKREEIYITNCVKCRPPNNRVPTFEEMKSCSIHLYKQINLIKPEIIICLGATSIQFLLQKKVSITKIRGLLIEAIVFNHKTYLFPTFHPSFLLRDNRNIPIAQKDFIQIANYLKKYNIF